MASVFHSGEYGDHFTLLAELEDVSVSVPSYPGAQTISAVFDSAAVLQKSPTFDQVIQAHPTMELTLAEEWDMTDLAAVQGQIPIAYSVDDQPNPDSTYNAIGPTGTKGTISAAELPPNTTLYLAPTERLRAIGKSTAFYTSLVANNCLLSGFIHAENDDFVYVTAREFGKLVTCNSLANSTAGAYLKVDFPCDDADRELNEFKDELRSFRFGSRGAFNNAFYAEGGIFRTAIAEMECTISVLGEDGAVIATILHVMPIRKRDARRNPLFGSFELLTVDVNLPVITWQTDRHEPFMTYSWLETDPGGTETTETVTVPLEVPDPNDPDESITINVEVENTFSSEDVDFGRILTEYCDPALGDGTDYSIGTTIEFNVGLDES